MLIYFNAVITDTWEIEISRKEEGIKGNLQTKSSKSKMRLL